MLICNTNTGCPTTVTTTLTTGTFEAGDVLTCGANGYPEPVYLWQDSGGFFVANTSNVTLMAGAYTLTCIAVGYLDSPCSAEGTISVIANGKYLHVSDTVCRLTSVLLVPQTPISTICL